MAGRGGRLSEPRRLPDRGSDGTTDPIYAYQHEPVHGSSITSVLVYDGDGFGDEYDNAIFFADHNRQFGEGDELRRGLLVVRRPRSTFISHKRVARPGWNRRQTAASIS